MSERKERIHSYALQTVKNQDLDPVNRNLQNAAIKKEAENYGIAPNEYLVYAQNNYDSLKRKLGKTGS